MSFAITRTGIFTYAAPSAYEYQLDEVIDSLNFLYRFNGHKTLSVLSHSMGMARHAFSLNYSNRVAFGCLVHDFPEAFTGDITTPVKQHFESLFPGLSFALSHLHRSIYEAMETQFKWPTLSKEEWDAVRLLDEKALYHELVHGKVLDDSYYTPVADFRRYYDELLAAINCAGESD